MYLLLLSLGVIVTALGLGAIAFGIPINEFGLGNTLIISGTTAFAGGLLLIALAALLRELRKIGATLAVEARTQPPIFESARAAPSLPAEPVAERPMERRPGAPARSAEPVLEDTEQVPLSPRPPLWPGRRPAERPTQREPAEPKLEPSSRAPAASAPRPAARAEPARPDAPAEAAPERRKMFDSVWPRGARKADVPPAPSEEPIFDIGAPQRPEPQAERRPAPAPAPASAATPPEPTPVSILKSGVIDGMAYTLYTDGSIEAQLAQGTVRFASIEDLRIHLEQDG